MSILDTRRPRRAPSASLRSVAKPPMSGGTSQGPKGVLVGHSYGGMAISGVADRVPEKVASLVYLDAFVPENGQSLFNVLPSDPRLTTVLGADLLVAPIPQPDSALNVQR